MQEKAVLLLGACTISGLGLPATLSLPVLIQRAFRNKTDYRLKIEAENHVDNLAQLLTMLESESFRGPYDVVLLQSLIGRETIPRLGMGERFNRPGWVGGLYRLIQKLDFTPRGHQLVNHFRVWFGQRRRPQSGYEQLLTACLQRIRQSSPDAEILVLGQGPPLSAIRAPFHEICELNRQKLHEYAKRHEFALIDLFPLLLPYEANQVYQEDGTHFTAFAQRIVAEAIIARLDEAFDLQSRRDLNC